MATHKSALKRHRQSVKRNVRNRSVKSGLLTMTKKVLAAGKDELVELTKSLQSQIARAGRKGVLNRKAASKRVSKLMKLANSK